jgi:hypothetical protein
MNYKPVTIIIDDFTSRSLSLSSSVSLYEAGYYNAVRFYDYQGFSYDYWGTEYSGSLGYYQNFGFDYFLPSTYVSWDYYNGSYGVTTGYNYLEWVSHSPSSESIAQHGDWVFDAFLDQMDSDVEVILIDFDSSGGYMNATQSDLLFSSISSIVSEWLTDNNTASVNYLPAVVSASFGGTLPSAPTSAALSLLTDAFAVIVQAIPNVTQGGFTWGDVFSDVINVGAYNIDSTDYSLHGNPVNPSVIDILANGYVEHAGWGNGWNFGTSFATPRVAAELTNLWIDLLNYINTQMDSGALTEADLESSGDINYADYVASLLDMISTDVFVEIAQTWLSDPITVLADDIANSPAPIKVSQLSDVGITAYEVTDASYGFPTNTIADQITNEDALYSYDTAVRFSTARADTIYSATLADDSVLPGWLSIDAYTGVLSGTPTNSDTGLLEISITTTSSGVHESDIFYLTIDNVNDAPIVSGSFSGSVTEDSATTTISGSISAADVDKYPYYGSATNWTNTVYTTDAQDRSVRTQTNTVGDTRIDKIDDSAVYTYTTDIALHDGSWYKYTGVDDRIDTKTYTRTNSLGEDQVDTKTYSSDGSYTVSFSGARENYGKIVSVGFDKVTINQEGELITIDIDDILEVR